MASPQNDSDLEQQRRVVVAIGASAGGLKPLQELFSLLPCDSGMTFIVIQHLSPDFDSVMDELLSRHTSMPIKIADDDMPLERDTVYLNPASVDVEVHGHRFALRPFDPDLLRLPINACFRSIANEYGRDAIAVVLSGTGSDGAEGLKAIKAVSGLTIAQSVETSQFDGMPKNAIATGVVDYVLSPAAIAHLIRESGTTIKPVPPAAIKADIADRQAVQEIFSLLSNAFDIDFSHYKPSTVSRRIDRRLMLSRYRGLSEYVDVLRGDQDELSNLYHDLLIGVTQFFRDRSAFALLGEELDKLVRTVGSDGPIRVWSAGCASGEEAYSIAILLRQIYLARGIEPDFKVFATDIHDRSLEFASRGVFKNEVLAELSDEQRAEYFEAIDTEHSKVHPDLRNHLVFARQNVVNDSAFTNLDVVTCRNLLIYLLEDAQLSAISSFHFSLKPNGLMMLGPSETLGKMSDGFDTVHKGWRLFRKNSRIRPGVEARRTRPSHASKRTSRTYDLVKAETQTVDSSTMNDELIASILDGTIVVDKLNRLVQIHGSAKDYLPTDHQSVGDSLSDSFSVSTQAAVYTLIATARKTIGVGISATNLPITFRGQEHLTNAYATAHQVSASNDLLVVLRFAPTMVGAEQAVNDLPTSDGTDLPTSDEIGFYGRSSVDEADPAVQNAATSESPQSVKLRQDLASTRESLGTLVKDMEVTNEEMQLVNEELVASNEELQATNEELQSVNEELYTVNEEHQRKVQELQEITDDFNSLFNSTRIGLILLDDKLRIRKFTKSSGRFFNLMQHDVGRPLSNFASKLKIDDFHAKVQAVVTSGDSFFVNERHEDGNWISVEVCPFFRSDETRGVIISFIDVTNAQNHVNHATENEDRSPRDARHNDDP